MQGFSPVSDSQRSLEILIATNRLSSWTMVEYYRAIGNRQLLNKRTPVNSGSQNQKLISTPPPSERRRRFLNIFPIKA